MTQQASFKLTQAGIKAILSGAADVQKSPLSAVLLSPAYSFNMAHKFYEEISNFIIKSPDHKPMALTGKQVIDPAAFIADPINFGGAVSLGPVGGVALVVAHPNALKNKSTLLAASVFSSGPVESVRAPFIISPSNTGWFALNQP